VPHDRRTVLDDRKTRREFSKSVFRTIDNCFVDHPQ